MEQEALNDQRLLATQMAPQSKQETRKTEPRLGIQEMDFNAGKVQLLQKPRPIVGGRWKQAINHGSVAIAIETFR